MPGILLIVNDAAGDFLQLSFGQGVDGIGSSQVTQQETAIFLQAYGDPSIDEDALTYYHYAWALQDIATFGEWVFFLPDIGADTRRAAVQGFKEQFTPGNIVDLALTSTRYAE